MFQIDSEIVRSVYNNLPNYKIDYDDSCTENICAIYFSSNDIYFPNTDEIFRKRIVEKDFFEWYHTRVKARKHIFVRDVFKQWYLEGINAEIDSPEKLYEWLKQETGGAKCGNYRQLCWRVCSCALWFFAKGKKGYSI